MERFVNASFREGRMVPLTSGKKYLGVVTPLVTAEKRTGFLPLPRGLLLCACVASFPVR